MGIRHQLRSAPKVRRATVSVDEGGRFKVEDAGPSAGDGKRAVLGGAMALPKALMCGAIQIKASPTFADWMRGRKLTVRKAAALLEISTNSVLRYRDDDVSVPKVVRLAIWALENGASLE